MGVAGHEPAVLVQKTERAKYEQMWERPEYRAIAPGEHCARLFLNVAKPKEGEEVIDFGTGTGRGALSLHVLGGLNVTALDFADNCLDREVRDLIDERPDRFRFRQHDLTKKYDGFAKFGYCTDVMEHIPPADVDKVLDNILGVARHVFFQIACEEDNLGALIGEPLHLTVQPYEWWLEKFNERQCTVHWSLDLKTHCLFYVSAFATGQDFHKAASVNTAEEQLRENIRANLKLGLQEVTPHETQDIEIMIVAGGPSLADYEDDIKAKRAAGMPLVTVNGAYNWCLERGLSPSATVVLDAREFNKRFVQPVIPGCKYLLASQCHPETVKSVPAEQVWLWHCGATGSLEDIVKEVCPEGESKFPVYGGMTVMLRALPLLRMLGFTKFHIYGFDSCLLEDKHHGYAQAENDMVTVVDVTVGGKTFKCHPWMLSQAHEFVEMVRRMLGDVCEMAVYGPGLIAHILETGADLSEEN